MTRRRWAAVILAVLALLALVALSPLGRAILTGRDRTWTRVRDAGVWRVGMDPSFPPFENLDIHTNQPVGFDVDLARAIAARWGVRVEFVGVGFDQLMDAVAAHRIDSAISALPVVEHRSQEMRFSTPYVEAGIVLAVPETSALATTLTAKTSWASAEARSALAGRRVAAEWGSEGDAQARALQKQLGGNLELVLRESTTAALDALVAGEADAALVDAISLALHPQEGQRLVAAGPPLRSDPYAIIVPWDAPELLRQINDALAALAADGTLAEIQKRWLRP